MGSPTGSSAELDALERRIVDHLFVLQPSYAVSLGLHEYDGRVPDLSAASTDRWATVASGLLGELQATGTSSLSPERQVDRILLRLLLESPLFDLRELKELDRNPMAYVGSMSLTPYLVRDYAPPSRRAAAIAELLESAPRLFEYGRRRLKGPLPKPFVDLALAIGGGMPAHFAEAESFSHKTDMAPEVAAARRTAEEALTRFLRWLRDEELPRATPDFALGPARYQRLLFVREGIETPFDELRTAGEADLARNQARLAELASAEGISVEALFERTHRIHPSATELLSTARKYVEETRRFVATHRLATIPEPAVCRVEETPVWGRALSTASMNPPGPFDTASSEGIYYITPVDPNWTPEQSEEWLRSLSHAMLRNITVHEVYPGHYLQFLHFRRSSASLARKVYLSPSFVEGWAHYAEQLAIEQGLGRESHAAEVAQVHDALLRDCRLLASVGLHTGGMSIEAATDLFQREGHFDRLPAEREAVRGTFNPEYFCYTLGKLAILDARRRHLLSRFGGQLSAFHDVLLGAGCPPVGLLERLFAGNSAR